MSFRTIPRYYLLVRTRVLISKKTRVIPISSTIISTMPKRARAVSRTVRARARCVERRGDVQRYRAPSPVLTTAGGPAHVAFGDQSQYSTRSSLWIHAVDWWCVLRHRILSLSPPVSILPLVRQSAAMYRLVPTSLPLSMCPLDWQSAQAHRAVRADRTGVLAQTPVPLCRWDQAYLPRMRHKKAAVG